MSTTILASGTTAADSSDVVVAAGSNATLGLFATGEIPTGVQVGVWQKTPGDSIRVDVLNYDKPSAVVVGPGTFFLKRGDISQYGVSVGGFSEP